MVTVFLSIYSINGGLCQPEDVTGDWTGVHSPDLPNLQLIMVVVVCPQIHSEV